MAISPLGYDWTVPSFGPFEVDFTSALVRKSGVRIRIQDQQLRILQALLERPGELVTREELRNRLWPSGTFVDFERSLNAAIGKLELELRAVARTAKQHRLRLQCHAVFTLLEHPVGNVACLSGFVACGDESRLRS